MIKLFLNNLKPFISTINHEISAFNKQQKKLYAITFNIIDAIHDSWTPKRRIKIHKKFTFGGRKPNKSSVPPQYPVLREWHYMYDLQCTVPNWISIIFLCAAFKWSACLCERMFIFFIFFCCFHRIVTFCIASMP